MSNFSVEVRTGPDGSLVVRPCGVLDTGCAVEFRQVLVHAVRRVRPLRLVLDLADVTAVDPINLGTLSALCDLADDHHVVVFLDNSSAAIAADLRAAGVPALRLRTDQPRAGQPTAAPSAAGRPAGPFAAGQPAGRSPAGQRTAGPSAAGQPAGPIAAGQPAGHSAAGPCAAGQPAGHSPAGQAGAGQPRETTMADTPAVASMS